MSDTSYQYTQATVTVSNAQPGQSISVVLTPESSNPDDQVNWSTGQPMTSSSTGIRLNAVSGVPVPVNSLSITGTTIAVYTSSGSGSTMTFTISASLVAASTVQYINIKSNSDPGVLVTFQFPGQTSITLSQTSTAVKWPS